MTKTLIETGEKLILAKLIGIEMDSKSFGGTIYREVITLTFRTNISGEATTFKTENLPSYDIENDTIGIKGTNVKDFFSSGLLGKLVLVDIAFEDCILYERLELKKLIPYNSEEVVADGS